jgi:hypothetical protein
LGDEVIEDVLQDADSRHVEFTDERDLGVPVQMTQLGGERRLGRIRIHNTLLVRGASYLYS